MKRGESVLILERDRPIARIVPVAEGERSDDDRLGDLEKSGVVRRAPHGALRKLPPPVVWAEGASVLEVLLQDRADARY